ncbi:MAG: hypothetical protein KY393_07250, partial [Actinobacteria bacterium]|nr:hypothetical protein [Actinomycetota bacterium]
CLLRFEDAEGRPLWYEPRTVLEGVVARFAELGLRPVAAVELEFYLIDRERTEVGGPQPPRSPLSGERKRAEVLQMAVLDPTLAVLDETDTGLDIDALQEVARGVLKVHNEQRGLLVITHYQRLLDYIQPTFVHVLIRGKIVRSGGKDLAQDLEAKGYDQFRTELGIPEGEELTDQA